MPSMLAIDYMAFAVAWVVGAWLVGVTAGKRGFSPVPWASPRWSCRPWSAWCCSPLSRHVAGLARDRRHSELGATVRGERSASVAGGAPALRLHQHGIYFGCRTG